MANLAARLLTWPQYLLPQKLLTGLAWRVSNFRASWFKNLFIATFASLFHVNLDEAERSEPDQYACFNDFFTRALKPGARPLATIEHRLISPCDGTISQLGRLDAGRIIQAKGLDYTAERLLGSPEWAQRFLNGRYITIYLAPNDYHRVHMPLAGRLLAEHRIPGRLFSVSAATTRAVPNLFARNERMVALFDTEHGPVAVVMVAAMLVAGIETVWGGPLDRRPGRQPRWRDFDQPLSLDRGAEIGRFHWGSTVIVLAPGDFPNWRESLAPGRRVRLGQALTN
ncbi:MAG: phosphatidylserine decarboxylase [Wenzhouxiangella sp.]|nr:phosphatidylserine decarboxylase [Wenzhouxiangella sp.]